eukprot:6472990-Amphidinium_carterae.2
MKASALMPTKRPEVINLRKSAKNAETGSGMLTGTYQKMPGLLRAMAKWNYMIREEAMQKFRTYFRHGHVIAVYVTKPSQEIYYCPASYQSEVSFASHEYKVAFLTYKGLYRNNNGNWQYDSDNPKYGAEVEQLGFFFYWYGMVTVDAQKTISAPEFLQSASSTRRIRQISTAPFPLSALKNDFAKLRLEQEAIDFTRGTMKDIVDRTARRQKKEEAQKKLLEEGPQAHVSGFLPTASASESAASGGLQAHVSESFPKGSALTGVKVKGLQAHVSGSLPSDSGQASTDASQPTEGLPGEDHPVSEGGEDEGGQDAQDRAAEGSLAAKTLGRYRPTYAPSDDKKLPGATRQPTGSDRWWKDQLAIQPSRHNSDVWEATRQIYRCPLCQVGTPISQMMTEHLANVHKVGLEPNRINEYSVGEVVSGINNVAMGKKFQFDQYAEKPKFQFVSMSNKINWLGPPLYDERGPCYPVSMRTQDYEELARDYRMTPTAQLNLDDPAIDLRTRVGAQNRLEGHPLIPVAMTSKLWWTRMTELAEGVPRILAGIPSDDFAATGNEVSGSRVGTSSSQTLKPPFRTMSHWRNLVRAWEMRNYENVKKYGWNRGVDWVNDPHPADMATLTQGATMTPTMLIEGKWETWSYADLMDPEMFFDILKKDAVNQNHLSLAQKQYKWGHIIQPLCSALGYELMAGNEMPYSPADGDKYYALMGIGAVASLKRCVRVPDASVHVNHELIHYVAQSFDCVKLLRLWKNRAESFQIYDGKCRFPHAIESKFDKQRDVEGDAKTGVEKGLCRYGTLKFHDALSAITDWAQHKSVLPDLVHKMAIWVGQKKYVGKEEIELDASFQGRTPLMFVRSASPVRRKEKNPEGKAVDLKKRRVELEDAPSGSRVGGVDMRRGTSPSGSRVGGVETSSLMSETHEGSIISGRSSSAVLYQADQVWEEEPMPVIEPTKELAPLDTQQELIFFKGQWNISKSGLTVKSYEGTPGDEFFDRKCSRLGRNRREDECLPMTAYLLPRYPLNEYDNSLRLGKKYNPTIQLTTRNLIGTLALDPKREVAWMTTRHKISNTTSAWENATEEGANMDNHYISSRLSDFQMQTKHKRTEVEYVRMADILQSVLENEHCTLDILCHRVASSGSKMAEEVVMWMHVIGRVILPYLRSKRQAWETPSLESLFRMLYESMGTEYMKDLSHIGAMAQYGDEINSEEMGVEPIHTSDFGNKLYAEVITEGRLPEYDDWTAKFSEEHKGDVIESIMGLNFLQMEERLDCSALGITQLEDAAETMIKTEWWAFMKGLTWSLAVLHNAPVISAICAVREACTNWEWTSTEKGGALNSLNGRMCLACGKRKNKNHEYGCYPRLIEGLIGHLAQGQVACVHDFLTGTEDMKFHKFINAQDVVDKWWTFKKRAFVVYVSENGHRQWPVGGYWDLEILTCSMQNVFKEFLPRLLQRMEDGTARIKATSMPYRDEYPVIPNHLTALLDPQIPWWEGCDFPINSTTELVEVWRSIEQRVVAQSQRFPQAVHNAAHRDCNMMEVLRDLQKEQSKRVHKMYAHVNYGRGIPVVIAANTLNDNVISLLGTRIKVMENAEWNRHNMSELQMLDDQALIEKLQQHMEFTANFLGKVEEAGIGASGSRVRAPQSPPVPAVIPTIVHQTEKQVDITITPGPMWKTTEFDESDVWLVGDDESMKKAVPITNLAVLTEVTPLNLTDNTWTPTKRVRGIVKPNPMKTGVLSGPQSFTWTTYRQRVLLQSPVSGILHEHGSKIISFCQKTMGSRR